MAKTLTVYLAADLKKFSGGLNDAERQITGFGGKLNQFLGPALIAATAAAGAFAVKLGVDGVKAAIEDEAASAKLAQTLTNLGLAHDVEPVEAYLSSLERSLGVADDQLRPAYDRLARSIGDTEGANKALALALDVSAGTGKSLDAVVQALGRAYDGNTAGLSRLGAGLDAATLRTGNMDTITAQLAATFGGQATTQAQTFQGQIDRLTLAASNLQEAFGKGLLGALEDTNDTTNSLVDTMADLEPVAEALGGVIGDNLTGALNDFAKAASTAEGGVNELRKSYEDQDFWAKTLSYTWRILNTDLLTLGQETVTLAKVTDQAGGSQEFLSDGLYMSAVAAERATPGFQAVTGVVDELGAESTDSAVRVMSLADALANVGKGTFNWRKEINGSTDAAKEYSIELNWNAYTARINAAAAAAAAASTRDYGGSSASAAADTDKLTKAQQAGIAAYERQDQALGETRKSLQAAMSDLDAATSKWKGYFDGISGGLQKGLDLAAAYEGQFTKEGEKTGISLLEGFNRQVAQVEWFGNVLTAMKAQGADAGFVSEVAGLGPGIGGALGQQLIDDGLVPTLSEKWVNAQTLISDKAAGIVPEFLTAGVNSAAELVTGLATQAKAETENLTKLGKAIAKPVGQGFKAEILDAVADALAKAEEARSAAASRAAANRAAERVTTTEQQVATALNNIIGRADARTGRPQPNVPFLVLG